MSRIVDFRDRVVAYVRANVPELREVDWYDGLFDEDDLKSWSAKPPCAFVSVTNAEDELVVTGETQADLDCVLVVIDQDRRQPRDADGRVWAILERVAILWRLQRFGDPNAAPVRNVRFRRLKDPVMRREGVAIGVVTWKSGVTIGTNVARESDYIRDAFGEPITRVPPTLTSRGLAIEEPILDLCEEDA